MFGISYIRDAYIKSIQSFAQFLFRKNWVISSFLVGSLFAEPYATIASGIRQHIFGWKASWKRHGFFDASSKQSLKDLKQVLKKQGGDQTPVILFNGIYSSPTIFDSWSHELEKARDRKEIGHVITRELPNELKARQLVVRQTIEDVCKIYKKALKLSDITMAKVDLIGHSLGGYAAHLAAYQYETVYDEKGVERRWHPQERNPLVRKVISIGAATWLCCDGQKDAFCPKNTDIYPLKGFDKEQLSLIEKSHANIHDIVATEDAISITYSPLPEKQVRYVKYGHLGCMRSLKVLRLVLSILRAR